MINIMEMQIETTVRHTASHPSRMVTMGKQIIASISEDAEKLEPSSG